MIEESDGPVEPGELQEATGLTATKLATALNRLEDAGAVELTSSGEVIPAAMTPEPGQAAQQRWKRRSSVRWWSSRAWR